MKPIDIIGLKNFRIFDAKEGFLEELSSINILTGANNSGKSSIVKLLQLLKNSVKESKYPFNLDLNQQEHLLGDFDNILNDKTNRKVEITLPFLFMGMKNIFIHLVFDYSCFVNIECIIFPFFVLAYTSSVPATCPIVKLMTFASYKQTKDHEN